MRKYSYEEFVRVDKNYCKDRLDFYGELSPLSSTEQKEFLDKYVKYHKKRFGLDASYTKAVSSLDVEETEKKLQLNATSSLKWTAYKRKMPTLFDGWQLYTDRAFEKGGVLVLKDSYKWPVPCAKYEFLNEKIQEISFSVRISKQYKVPVCGGVLSTTTGRFIELRNGVKEIIKLYFSPNGYFTYKDSSVDVYRYKNNVLGKYKFDEWNDIKIRLTSDGFVIQFNDVTQEFKRDITIIDNLFIGGGMQPVDEWSVKLHCFISDKRTVKDFFVKSTNQAHDDFIIGEVNLPFVLGTEINKDTALVLKSKAFCTSNKAYKLSVDALDPGGEVLINGQLVIKKYDFQPFSLDVTGFLNEGENDLEIIVYPRAPESLFNWHKHNDYYNGWFCLGCDLIECQIFCQAMLEVETRHVGEFTDFDVIIKNINFPKKLIGDKITYKIHLQKTFPCIKEKKLLCRENFTQGDVCKSFTEKVELWDTDNPVLYDVIVEFYNARDLICSLSTQTGFRTITQKDGELYLNNEKLVLKGALSMQFLPPYDEVPLNHICPSTKQIIEQILMLKSMNANCLRMHFLGYGSNDKRYAEICDRLGVMLIWTTRLIDSAENMQWSEDWKQADDFKKQILQVKNHPSIIIWEGSNEGHFYPSLIDKVYDNFVSAVKSVDTTRLLCPISHLYYSWGDEGEKCGYYNNEGTRDEEGNPVCCSYGWKDELVIRSAHPYGILLGYGQPWQHMVTQCYKFQNDLLDDCDKAYIASEFAIIGRQNPNTPEAKKFINKNSYEFNDELTALGFVFLDDEWELSQAFQALCAAVATKQLRKLNVDGMLWCCLTGGANNASYLKPIIDFYGYKKLAYYQLKEAFQKVTAFNENPDVLYDGDYTLKPIAIGAKYNKNYSLLVEIYNEEDVMVKTKTFDKFCRVNGKVSFEKWTPKLDSGYYTIRYTVEES